MSDKLNGMDIHTTDEVISHIAVYIRRMQDSRILDAQELAHELYDDLVEMRVIRSFEDLVRYALSRGKDG